MSDLEDMDLTYLNEAKFVLADTNCSTIDLINQLF